MKIKDKIISEIKKIYDPEIPVNIYELGLIYDVNVDENNKVYVKMTLTTPNCPVAESLFKKGICLPLHHDLSKDDIDHIAACINQF